jgi:hypothetical protein
MPVPVHRLPFAIDTKMSLNVASNEEQRLTTLISMNGSNVTEEWPHSEQRTSERSKP